MPPDVAAGTESIYIRLLEVNFMSAEGRRRLQSLDQALAMSSGRTLSKSSRLTCRGMVKAEQAGVERLAVEAADQRARARLGSARATGRRPRAVERVAEHADGRYGPYGRGSGGCGRSPAGRRPGCAGRPQTALDRDSGSAPACRRAATTAIFLRLRGLRPMLPSISPAGRRAARPRPGRRSARVDACACGELRGEARYGPRRSWRRPSGRWCPCPAGGRCPAASRRRCPTGCRRNGRSGR